MLADEEVKAPNLFGRAKEEIQAILHSEKLPHHHKETHGKGNEIDVNTPLDDVRAPNVFDRAKEEFEALVQTIHPKKDSPAHERQSESCSPLNLNQGLKINFLICLDCFLIVFYLNVIAGLKLQRRNPKRMKWIFYQV